MKIRSLALVALSASLVLVAGACGSDTSSAASPATSAASSKTTATSADVASTTEDSNATTGTIPDVTIPGLGDLNNCVQLGTAYASLATSVLTGGNDGAKKAHDAVEALKKKFPDLSDDLDTVASAFNDIATKGLVQGAQGLDSAAFKAANEKVTNEIGASCGATTTTAG